MPSEIEVLDAVIERLKHACNPDITNLYGTVYNGKILIMGFGSCLSSLVSDKDSLSCSFVSSFDKHQVIYPAGIDFIGALAIKNDNGFDKKDILQRLKDVQVTNNPLYLEVDSVNNEFKVCYRHQENLVPSTFSIVPSNTFRERFVYLRLVGNVSFSLPLGPKEAFDEFEEHTKRMSEEMVFRIGRTNQLISRLNMSTHLRCIGDVYDIEKSGKLRDWKSGFEVLSIHALLPSTVKSEAGTNMSAPIAVDFTCSHPTEVVDQQFRMHINLPFDDLCLVQRDKDIRDTYSSLVDCAERIAHLSASYIRKHLEDPHGLLTLHPYHFNPKELGHPVTLIYIPKETDKEPEEVNASVHNFFNLPSHVPLFKKGCAMEFKDHGYVHIPFLNIHTGVKPPRMKGTDCKTAFVQGYYEYYHYMQQGMNDKGWGCAYRSLQTICSWYKLQGYTTKPVPTHIQIQEALVHCGDKPHKIINSKTWIGSIEVSYALETYLPKVSSMFHSVPTGTELSLTGPLLYEHFRTAGTPIMIGGGVLAHTIAGVSYDEESGDIKFLILDPHYTGEDDLDKIYKGGYVGWKGMDFWNQGAYYNLCMPQRPSV